MSIDPTKRFSNRVEHYSKYRPKYPTEVLDFVKRNLDLTIETIVADIGSGTGILTELFLRNGNMVYAIEPNLEMRQAAEESLASYQNFKSIAATAEATSLAANSIDLITVGQAFHWFDIPRTKVEFSRIIKPGGWVLLVWNQRLSQSSPFQQAYEQVLQDYTVEYRQVNHKNVSEQTLLDFFDPSGKIVTFDNFQSFDVAGLKGRALSSSYSPASGHPNHIPFIVQLERIFEQFQQDGVVRFSYETKLYYGQLSSSISLTIP